MNKSDMKNGMRVKIRNGNMYIYMDGRLLRKQGWLDFEEDYTDSLACKVVQWEIVSIWESDNTNIDENCVTGEPIYDLARKQNALIKKIAEEDATLRVLKTQVEAVEHTLAELRQELDGMV